uniref:Box brain protein n=1 Tax=Echinococcus granulosus TaxID=6210 RepID=A0A068WPU8_ECHGR|nr:box brain protein [Echinococcus granulosus]
MAATFEQRQGNNYEEPSPEAEVSGASAGSEVRHSSCNPPPAVKPNLYSALLAITQRVPNMWHTHFSSTREKFSSICVAGADFDFLNLMGRPTITLRLRDKAAWRAIWPHQMEMITSKNGRRIFPTLTVSVEGLNADERYTFFLDLMPKDQNICRFQSGRWIASQIPKPPPPNQDTLIYVSRSVCEWGSKLMAGGVDFKLVKITNNACTALRKNQIFARGMQIYLPRYHIVRHVTSEEAAACQPDESGRCRDFPADLKHVGTYVIPETEFIAVTAYRNKHVSDAKISINPYAKACKNRRRSAKSSN